MSDHNTELRKAGLKVTLPRVKILDILQDPNHQHISAEDVYKILLELGEDIGPVSYTHLTLPTKA